MTSPGPTFTVLGLGGIYTPTHSFIDEYILTFYSCHEWAIKMKSSYLLTVPLNCF